MVNTSTGTVLYQTGDIYASDNGKFYQVNISTYIMFKVFFSQNLKKKRIWREKNQVLGKNIKKVERFCRLIFNLSSKTYYYYS